MYPLQILYTTTMKVPASIAVVFRAISDEKSLTLFRAIAREAEGIDTEKLRDRTRFTRKQYYSRMEKMLKSGLIRRTKGKYVLTSFGKVIYEALRTAENGLENFWKLKAMDSLITTRELQDDEQRKVLDALLDNEELKKIVHKD
jgi:Mn-dependent DtxR family transcriptional regulator